MIQGSCTYKLLGELSFRLVVETDANNACECLEFGSGIYGAVNNNNIIICTLNTFERLRDSYLKQNLDDVEF